MKNYFSNIDSDDEISLAYIGTELVVTNHSYARWIKRCMSAAGGTNLSSIDSLVLIYIHQCQFPLRLTDIAYRFSIEHLHTINYSIKNLHRLSLVLSKKDGKHILYSLSPNGILLCDRYHEICDNVLNKDGTLNNSDNHKLVELAYTLRALAGLYDCASRSTGLKHT